MKKNLTELVFILDRSGSMAGLEKDTIGGFNSMIAQQKAAEGDALVSTVVTQHDEDGMVHSKLMNVRGEGFVFGLYSSDPIEYAGGTLPADTLIETGITDADGSLTFAGEYPHGEYYVQELAAPEGWVLSDARYRVTITDEFADEQHEVVFQVGLPIHNEIVHADVRIAKTDKTGSVALPGALIEVRNGEGKIVCRDYTGEDGYLPAFPALPGTYTYREVLAPEASLPHESAPDAL